MSTVPDRIVINLNEMTSRYELGLVDTLRHFGLEGEFLETWVPDPNLVKSVINLANSAAEAKLDAVIELQLSREMIDGRMLDELVNQLMTTLDVEIDDAGEHITIVLSGFCRMSGQSLGDTALSVTNQNTASAGGTEAVSHMVSPAPQISSGTTEPLINPFYDQPSLSTISHRTKLKPREDWCLLETKQNGILFQVQVNLDTHRIENAAFDGDVPARFEVLLEQLCVLITGFPILEASDHGVARLEFLLRGSQSQRPVQGIVIPARIDRRFGVMQDLVRNVLSEYRRIAAYTNTANDYDSGPGKLWLACSDQERKTRLQAVYDITLRSMGLDPTEIEILEIEYDVRVLVRLTGQLAKLETDKQALLMRLEMAMIEQIDGRLELYLEPVQDMSTLRRLTPDN